MQPFACPAPRRCLTAGCRAEPSARTPQQRGATAAPLSALRGPSSGNLGLPTSTAPAGICEPRVYPGFGRGGIQQRTRRDGSSSAKPPCALPSAGVVGPCIPELAAAAAADPAAPAQATLGVLFAKISGASIALGSILLFTPIILNILRHRTGEGISIATFWMQLIGFSAVFLYNNSKGFPLAAYGENASLALQSLVILVLAKYYSKAGINKRFCFGLLAYAAWVGSCLAGLLPPSAMFGMQVLAMIVITGAIVPQILLNFKRKDTGEWSIITATMSTGGNAIRVFTTLQLTHDPLLLAGYLAGFAVNATLLWQIIAYRRPAVAAAAAGDAPSDGTE